MSTFAGIELGRRALAANQQALNVTGHNTSNVNTPGYTRQIVNLQSTDPYTVPGPTSPSYGQVGTGVTVSSITRIRDGFVDNRVRGSLSDQSASSEEATVLKRVEQAFTEPGDNGIGAQLTKFFSAFSDLAAKPDNSATRTTVISAAQNVSQTFHSVNSLLVAINPEINATIADRTKQINDLTSQLASLNTQISTSVASGQNPNDLQDKQGKLLQDLSQLVDIQTVNVINSTSGKPTGEINVSVGGYGVVVNSATQKLPSTILNDGNGPALVTDSGVKVSLKGGSLYGLVSASQKLDGYTQQLNTLANQFITSVNTLHEGGVDKTGTAGIAFFTGTDAGTIQVSPILAQNTDLIAASAKPAFGNPFAPGNGDNARAISQLSYTNVVGNQTLNQYYNAQVAQIGSDSKSAQDRTATNGAVVSQLQAQQSSVSGVSLDEEMSKLLQYQKSYQAAAKLVNVYDSVLDSIIIGIGGKF